jgi:uncharacterized protein YndB with AHSA1/START domain
MKLRALAYQEGATQDDRDSGMLMTSLRPNQVVWDEPPPETPQLASVTAERLLEVPCTSLWPLWATKEGIKSWWSPEGFVFEMLAIEVYPGGRIESQYEGAAAVGNPQWREELRAKRVSASWTARGTFLEVDPPRRLVFRQALDFGTRSRPQEYRMTSEFRPEAEGTRLNLKAEATPSKHWTLLGRQNLVGQMDRLANVCRAAMARQSGNHWSVI